MTLTQMLEEIIDNTPQNRVWNHKCKDTSQAAKIFTLFRLWGFNEVAISYTWVSVR